MIRFPCSKCKREFAVDNAFAGQVGNCSWCGAPMTVPQPYAEGTTTDEMPDPNLSVQSAPDEHNPYQLPEYQQGNPQSYHQPNTSSGAGGSQIGGWAIFIIIIILANVILIPLTGWAVIPR